MNLALYDIYIMTDGKSVLRLEKYGACWNTRCFSGNYSWINT